MNLAAVTSALKECKRVENRAEKVFVKEPGLALKRLPIVQIPS